MCSPSSNETTNLSEKEVKENTASVKMDDSKTTAKQVPDWYAKRKVHEKSLEDQSNWFSDIFLFYLSPLLRLGAVKLLEDDDIGVPSAEDQAGQTFDRIKKAWTYQLAKAGRLNTIRKAKYDAKLAKLSQSKKAEMPPFVPSEPGVATALAVSFGVWRILWAIFLYALSALMGFVPVLLLKGKENETTFH